MTEYHKLARKKFPYGEIRGDGRWACVRRCPQSHGHRWQISLHVDMDHAERAAARECTYGCQGPIAYHFTLPIAPPEATAPTPVVKPVEPPPLIGMMKP
jgi:hypothetical protein